MPALLERIDDFLNATPDPDYDFELQPARVPEDDFADRYVGHLAIDPAVRFVDVDHPDTHAALARPLRPLLRAQGLRAVDRGITFSPDRGLTRPIARHYWTLAQSADHHDWAGLRYESRLLAEWECWALWEPSPIRMHGSTVHAVTRSNQDLRSAADRLGLDL